MIKLTRKKLKNTSGQAVIEYMALFTVLFFVTLAFWKQAVPEVVLKLRNEQGRIARCLTDHTKVCP